MAGAYSYEQAFLVIRQLGLGMESIEELFRRMAFNIIARNQDDHVKNIAFLMNQSGSWSLAPAFDITYSYQPQGKWTSSHQMTMNGKQDNFSMDDFESCAAVVSMKRGGAKALVKSVSSVIARWNDYADDTGVSPDFRDQIAGALRLDLIR